MNAVVPASTRTVASQGLMPRDFDQAMRLAEMMARSELVPGHLQRKPADCLLVVEQAMRWNMSPFAVAQGTFVTKGKIGYAGTLMHAAVEQNAPVQGHLSYRFIGEGETRAVIVSGRMIGETEPREVEVKLREARTTNEWWKKTPDQMLCYHGARVWARRHTPGVIFGAYSREELVDAMEVEPREVPNLAQPAAPPPAGSMREVAAEVVAGKAGLPIMAPDTTIRRVSPGRYLDKVREALAKMESAAALRTWCLAMVPCLAEVRAFDDALAHDAEQLAEGRMVEFAGPPDAEPGAVEIDEEVGA